MKKILIASAFFFCVGLADAQSTFRLIRGVDALGFVKVVYTNTDEVDLGWVTSHDYSYDTGSNVVAYIVINDKICYPEDVTTVVLEGGVTAEVSCTLTADGPVYKEN